MSRPRQPSLWSPSALVATCFGAGLAPLAPGTVGSLVAALVMALALQLGLGEGEGSSAWLVRLSVPAILLAFSYVAGIWASERYMAESGEHDPGAIVIDEVAGVFAAWLSGLLFFGPLFQVLYYLKHWAGQLVTGTPLLSVPAEWALQPLTHAALIFVLFRTFDIAKPGFIRRIDSEIDGARGVMLDDVVAGIAAGLVWALLAAAFGGHFWAKP